MTQHLKIDFVSDVVCPWCMIGLLGLKEALRRLDGVVDADIAFQPFEVNPHMGRDGQNIVEHITEKYGITPEQSAENRAAIRERAAKLGFDFNMTDERRIYNTRDAHRLLYWAAPSGHQTALEQALFRAYFTDGANISSRDVLVAAAVAAGLNGDEARGVLESGLYNDEVAAAEELWLSRGIHAVPGVVVNDRWLISGGQSADVFENALRDIAKESAASAALEQ